MRTLQAPAIFVGLIIAFTLGWTIAGRSAQGSGEAAPAAKVIAFVSLVAWFGVIFFGRMIMYNDTLLYVLGQ